MQLEFAVFLIVFCTKRDCTVFSRFVWKVRLSIANWGWATGIGGAERMLRKVSVGVFIGGGRGGDRNCVMMVNDIVVLHGVRFCEIFLVRVCNLSQPQL